MTSVDSGVETSNESNDSCIISNQKSLDISPVKISSGATHVNAIVMSDKGIVNSASSSSSSQFIDCNIEKEKSQLEKQLPLLPQRKSQVIAFEPPGGSGLLYWNISSTCGFQDGVELRGEVEHPDMIISGDDRPGNVEIEPPTGLSFHNLQPSHGCDNSYELLRKIIDCNKEKTNSEKLSILPQRKLEPPAGLSFCNLQPTCGFENGYEILGKVGNTALFSPRDERRANRARRSKRKFYDVCHTLKNERRLRHAAAVNNEELVASLLESGVNPNCYDQLRRTPLHFSACRGYSNVVRLLLEKGADPMQRDALNNTPLHLAACTNHVEVVTLLLKAGTDVNSIDFYGRSPLQLAQSKLKFLQKTSNNADSVKVKQEVQKVVEMMFTFLHKNGRDLEAEVLSMFQNRLTISCTKEEVENGVRDLLTSLNNLDINKSNG